VDKVIINEHDIWRAQWKVRVEVIKRYPITPTSSLNQLDSPSSNFFAKKKKKINIDVDIKDSHATIVEYLQRVLRQYNRGFPLFICLANQRAPRNPLTIGEILKETPRLWHVQKIYKFNIICSSCVRLLFFYFNATIIIIQIISVILLIKFYFYLHYKVNDNNKIIRLYTGRAKFILVWLV